MGIVRKPLLIHPGRFTTGTTESLNGNLPRVELTQSLWRQPWSNWHRSTEADAAVRIHLPKRCALSEDGSVFDEPHPLTPIRCAETSRPSSGIAPSIRGEDLFARLILKDEPHYKTLYNTLAASIRDYFRRRPGGCELAASDLRSAQPSLRSHHLAEILFGHPEPRLCLTFPEAAFPPVASRLTGGNDKSSAITVGLPSSLLRIHTGLEAGKLTDFTNVVFLREPTTSGYSAEDYARSEAHEIGHALDPQLNYMQVYPTSIFLREMIAFSGETLNYGQLRQAERATSLNTWYYYARVFLQSHLQKGLPTVELKEAERDLLEINSEALPIDGYFGELAERIATGVQRLYQRLLRRFTTVEAICLLHKCRKFEDLQARLTECEIKRPVLIATSNPQDGINAFLQSLDIYPPNPPLPKVAYNYLAAAINPMLDAFFAFQRFYEFSERSVTVTTPNSTLSKNAVGLFLSPDILFDKDKTQILGLGLPWDTNLREQIARVGLKLWSKLISLTTENNATFDEKGFKHFRIHEINTTDSYRYTIEW